MNCKIFSKDKFRSIASVINEDLTPYQRNQLYDRIVAAVSQVDARDIALLLPLLAGNAAIQQAILRTVVSFVTNDLQLYVQDK